MKGCRYFITPAFPSAGIGIKGEAGENEYGVCLSATETLCANEAALAADPYVIPGVAESNIPTLVLPYVTTAREAVDRLGMLVETYGSAESNGVVFGDDRETWYMEIYTGHQWAAVKCPEDRYAVIGNDAMLGYVDPGDTENCAASETIYTLAEENGFLKEIGGKPHLAATYNAELRDYSQIRVWSGRHWFAPSEAGEYDVACRYNLFVKPDGKIAVGDMMEFMRYRFEDTEYSCDIPGNNYRPVGIERTATAHLFGTAEDASAIAWVALANPEYSVFMPLYGIPDRVPDAFTTDAAAYDENNAYWQFRAVSSLATLDREKYGSEIRAVYKALETEWIAGQDAVLEAFDGTPEAASGLFETVSGKALETADALLGRLLTMISRDAVSASDSFGFDR